MLHINGYINYGDAGFNEPWSWHIIPNDWTLTEISFDICNGTPDEIENNLTYWISTIGQLCNWGSYIKNEIGNEHGTLSNNNEFIPTKFILHNPYPNPFNPTTTIGFEVPRSEYVKFRIFDIKGRVVERFINQKVNSGYNKLKWNASSQSSGLYFFELTTKNNYATTKLLLIK